MINFLAVKLDLREFETFPARKHLEVDLEKFSLDFEGVCGVKELSVDFTLVKSENEYYCQSSIKAVVTLECARCLNEYDTEITCKQNFVICSEGQLAEFRKEADDDEDYVFLDVSGYRVDVSKILRQAIILNTPLKPICSADCQGLCSSCGKNLNMGSCDCKKDETDMRWDALKKISRREL